MLKSRKEVRIEIEKINMIYDVKDFSKLLDEFIQIEKQIQSLSNKQSTPEIQKKLNSLKNEFGVIHRRIQVLRNFYEDPRKLQAQFTGCVFITFKTQEMFKRVLEESRKSDFYTEVESATTLRKLKKKKKRIKSFIIKKAPEPSDIIWFNFVREYDGRKWFALSIVAVVLVNITFIFIFKYIKKLQHKYLDENEEINILTFCKK
jgi:hypothetical protein